MKFTKYSPYKKIALHYLISILDRKATDDSRRAFEFLDQNKDGEIDAEEIKEAIELYGLDEECQQILDKKLR